MHETNNWVEFFDTKFFNLFDRSFLLKELVTQVRHIIKPSAAILEVGCGSGLTAVLLASIGYRVTAIDTNAEIIQKLKQFELVFPNVFFQQMDMFHLKFVNKNFDVSFSQGVLEHYPDDDIVWELVEQKRVAETIIVDVPNGKGKLGDYGDERTISVVKWREIIRKAGLTIIHESARGMSRRRFKKILNLLFYFFLECYNFRSICPILYCENLKLMTRNILLNGGEIGT